MCIAVYQPAGKVLSGNAFMNCWEKNSDGGGFMFVDDEGKIQIYKEMTDPDYLYDLYTWANTSFPKSPFVLHFRFATHGTINKYNTHPFRVNRNLAFVHNGVLSEHGSHHSPKSDTIHFKRDILRNLPPDFIHSNAILTLLDDYCLGSKLIFLSAKRDVVIINSGSGVTDNGFWFSNEDYKDQTKAELRKKSTTWSAQKGKEKDDEELDINVILDDDLDEAKTVTLTKEDDEGSEIVVDMCMACGRYALKTEDEMAMGICKKCMTSYGFDPEDSNNWI